MSARTVTLRRHLTAAAAAAIIATASFGAGFIVFQPADVGTQPASTNTAGPIQRLMDRHDCWTLDEGAPADMVGKLPGHVVVTRKGSDDSPTYSADLVGPALEQIAFDIPKLGWQPAVDHGLVVRGACR